MTKLSTFGLTLIAMAVAASASYAQPAPGSKPLVPLKHSQAQRLGPAGVAGLGADLPPVQVGPVANSKAPTSALDSSPSPFSPDGLPPGYQSITGPPGSPNLSNPLVLTDGSVIFHVSCTGTWWKLTPGNTGSYATGTWSAVAGMPAGHTPRFFSSAVLPDGRVIVEGGEYNTNCASEWTNKGAIYNPLTNSWAVVAPPSGWAQIGDSQATVLANGTYFQADCCDSRHQVCAVEPNHFNVDSNRHRQVQFL